MSVISAGGPASAGGGLSPQAAMKLALDETTLSQADAAVKRAQAALEADASSKNAALQARDAEALKQAELVEQKAQTQLVADQAAFGSEVNASTEAATKEDATRLAKQVAVAATVTDARPNKKNQTLDLRV